MTHIVYNMTLPLFALLLFLFCVTESEQTVLALYFLGLAPVVSVLIYVLLWLSLTLVLYDRPLACPI